MNDYAHALRRRWPIVAGVVVIGLVALALFGRGRAPEYRATHVVVFQEAGNPSPDAYGRDLRATAALARTPEVAARVVGRLNALNSPTDLARKITAQANVDANTIAIATVPYSSASKARELANGFAAELTTALGDQSQANVQQASQAAGAEQEATQNAIRSVEAKLAAAAKGPVDQQDILRAQRDALLKHLQDTIVSNLATPPQQTLTSVGGATVQKIEHNRLAPNSIPGWMFAAALLGILGAAIALIVDRLDGRLRDRGRVERAFGLPVLAEVPPLPAGDEGGGVVTTTQPVSAAADAFRDLRTALARFGRSGRSSSGRGHQLDLTAVMVTSANRGEGKTSTAVNLAAAVAETGKSVLVIDCDLRAPRAHELFGVVTGAGLSDVLSGSASIDQVAVETSVPGVRLVSAGEAVENPSALFARQHDFVAPARMLADFVVLDGPPLALHDAAELLWMVDAVVVSCRSGSTTADDAARASEQLAVLGAPPCGVVITGSPDRGDREEERTPEPGNGQLVEAMRPLPLPTAVSDRPAPGGQAPPRPPLVPGAGPPAPPPPIPTPPPIPVPAAPSSSGASSGGSSSLSISVPSPARASIATAPAPTNWGTRVQPGAAVATKPAPPAAAAMPKTAPQAPPRPPAPPAPPPASAPAEALEAQPAADSDTIRRQLALPARRIAGWAGTVALMVVMWVIIRTFLFQSFYIPSPSMAPALKPGDRVLVSKLSYRLHDVHRGDIVVFKRPPHVQAGPEVKDLVKRVVGLPGDTVEARNGQVLVNGKALKEPYVPQGAATTNVAPTHIAKNHYWVMGDNRTVSEDSRYFGSINGDLIVGRVFFQVWPVSSVGLI